MYLDYFGHPFMRIITSTVPVEDLLCRKGVKSSTKVVNRVEEIENKNIATFLLG